ADICILYSKESVVTKMHVRSYKFANVLWSDYLYNNKSLTKTALNVIILSSIPWVIGIFIAADVGRGSLYLRTPIFYIGSIGIMITTFTLIYGSFQHFTIYEHILECFILTNDERQEIVHNVLDRYYN